MPDFTCANYETNRLMCACTNTECANWAICCLCVRAHNDSGSLTACMRTLRPATTLSLKGSAAACLQREVNLPLCACTYDPCDNRGVCCECLRNHWTVDGAGRPACLK